MVEYAVKLTRKPTSVTEQDIHALRAAGLEDDEILDACQIIAYYNFVNRMADGLGVELEAPSATPAPPPGRGQSIHPKD